VGYKVEEGEASCLISPYSQKGMKQETAMQLRLLSHVYVPAEHRRKGHASKLMRKIGKEADESQLTLIVEPKAYDDGELDGEALMAFYKQHGFIELQKEPCLMVRIPIPPMLFNHVKETHSAIQDVYGNAIH
jgi:predicted GNAT family acetyltransferase